MLKTILHDLRIFSLACAAFLFSSAALAQSAPAAQEPEPAHAAAVRQLLAGVREIAAPGVPGPLVVVGERAFPVITGKVGKNIFAPVVAASTLGRGRVVAFGHSGYAGREALATADTLRLMQNAIDWTAERAANAEKPPRVGALDNGWAKALTEKNIPAEWLDGKDWSARLENKEFDVLCVTQAARTDAEIAALRNFVQNGGGLLVAGLGWGWLQLNPDQELDAHPGNRLLAETGILWADGTLSRTAKSGFSAEKPATELCQASRAVAAVLEHSQGQRKLDNAALAQAAWTTGLAVRTLPPTDNLLRPRLRTLLNEHKDELVPTEKKPLTNKDALARLLLTLQVEDAKRLPPEQVPAHPAAREFPGAVPSDAEPVTRKLEIDCAVPDWRGTGLYAAPGRIVMVEIPPEAAKAKLALRIGAHQDELWDKDKWSRVPEITRAYPLNKTKTPVASAFGGPVYLVVPRGCKLGKIEVTIRGAVAMPRFVRGETKLEDWREKIRKFPAPWAELESKKIILTIPARVVRELDDPESVMQFWDELSDAHAALAMIPPERERPERFVADVQISAGYMHSGYPIMTHLDVAERFVDAPKLRAGDGVWGFFHELGHNHQEGDWTFDGTGEVTCNLFALHALDTICKLPDGKRGHDAVEKPPSIAKYISNGAKFADWKKDPFLALQMYIQLQKEFGWETYKKVFAEYRALPKEQRPKNDAEKRDQWLVRFSRATSKNLGPFFQAWGVPTSEAARSSLADLPAWMPADFPPKE